MSAGELWDVTDAAGTPTGRTHRRGDPDFPSGSFHIVASVCVVRDDGRVLITRRAAVKDFALLWEFPAGSALAGETSREAAVRELREETGLDASVDALEIIGRLTERTALFDVYAVRDLDSLALALDPDEVCESAWVGLDEVRRLCRDGRMAGPWVPRLEQLGPRLAEFIAAGRA